MSDYTMYGLRELRKLSKANFEKIRSLEEDAKSIDVSVELEYARVEDVAIRYALAKAEERAAARRK